MAVKDHVDLLIQALRDEAVAAAKKNKVTGIILLKGKLQSQIDQISIYKFVTTKLCFQPDESQGKLIFRNNEYACTILATQGLYVHVAIEALPEGFASDTAQSAKSGTAPIRIDGTETTSSPTIEKATFVPTGNTIYERLIDRFEQTPAENRSKTFNFAETVFNGKTQRLVSRMKAPLYSYEEHNEPNDSQDARSKIPSTIRWRSSGDHPAQAKQRP